MIVTLPDIIFWILVLIVIYVYLFYPLILLAISQFGKKNQLEQKLPAMPRVTLFIPVYNEEDIISQKIKNSLSLNYPQDLLEIVVVSDASTDNTTDILNPYIAKGIKIFVNERNEGKNVLINKYVQKTMGDIIVFTDANSMFSADSINNIVRWFSNPRIGCVGGRLVYQKGKSSTAKGEGFYFKYENLIRKLEGRKGHMVGANGAIYAIRRELFIPVPSHVPNDFFHPLSVLKRDYFSVFDENAVAFEKPTESGKEEFDRRVRIVSRSIGALIEVNRQFGVFKGRGWFNIISHKILRWFIFPILLLIFILNLFLLESPVYFVLFILQTTFYLMGIGGFLLDKAGLKFKLFFIPYYFLLINLAAITGIYRYFMGERVITWQSASTTR